MYKLMISHYVAPGKQRALEAWFKEADQKRAKADPKYVVPKRYMTIFGGQNKVVVEFEIEDAAAVALLLEPRSPIPGGGGDMWECVVPGMSEMLLLREMELR